MHHQTGPDLDNRSFANRARSPDEATASLEIRTIGEACQVSCEAKTNRVLRYRV